MLKSYRAILFLSFISVVGLTLLLFSLLAAPRLKTAAANLIASGLFRQAAISSDQVAGLIFAGDLAGLQRHVEFLTKLSDSRVTVIDGRGVVLAESNVPAGGLRAMENHFNCPEIVSARKNGRGQAVRFSQSLQTEQIYAAVLLKGPNGQGLGYLRFAVPASRMAALSEKMQKSLLAALVAAFLVVFLVSIGLANWLGRPLSRLSRVAEEIAEGKFPQTILRRSPVEIGRLEDAVEKMSWKLAEMFKKLNSKREQMAAVVSSMEEGVLALDASGRVILANPAVEKTFGVIEIDILGKTAREAVRNNEIADLLENALQNRQAVQRELEIITPIRGEFMVRAMPVKVRAGNFFGVVAVLYNVSELRRLEQHRSEFVANISHELKTPLTAIRSLVETLLGGAAADPKANRGFLEKIEKQTRNLTALVDDILEISRLESGKVPEPFEKIDLCRLVDRAVEAVEEPARKKNVKIEKACDGAGKTIVGIEDHAYRAIVNLLNNAVNYNRDGGKVTVECCRIDNQAKIIISDTGIGIAENHLPRIFERFYRTDAARSREMGGTGLGLAIVKHVMNVHGGSVKVESVEGEGSKFTLIFPLVDG